MEKARAQLPSSLETAFRRGHGAVFVGAGVSVEARMPTWQQLSMELAKDLAPSSVQDLAGTARFLAAVPQYHENEHGREALVSRVRELIPPTQKGPSRIHALLAQLPCTLYYTTNFDVLLENALLDQGRSPDVIIDEEGARENSRRDRSQVRKIHGSIDRAGSLVMTRTDFARYKRLHPILCDHLKIDLAAQTFLFAGYSLSDPDFNSVYDDFISRYAPFNRHHFITVFEIDDHERRDLQSRGLHPIDLTGWGHTASDGLADFLSRLCESTSQALHIRRFFRGIQGEATVPIVVPSDFDKKEMALTYHAMDMNVAVAIDHALAILGQTSVISADKTVISNAESLLAENLILVGSTSGNVLTRLVFERAQEADRTHHSITSRFQSCEGGRVLMDDVLKFSYTSPDPSLRLGKAHRRPAREYALIARFPNPWVADKWIFVFAGLWGMGTHAVGDFLHNLDNFQCLPWTEDCAIAVLEASYRRFDPIRPSYESKLIAHTE